MISCKKFLSKRFFQASLKNYFCCTKNKQPALVNIQEKNVIWNLSSIDTSQCSIQCLVIQNNKNYSMGWLQKILPLTQSILLPDGGANILYQTQQLFDISYNSKVRAIVGDLDSVKPEIEEYYRNHKVQILKDKDQQKNDFEKTILYGIEKGYKNFIISGAFGDRLDHTFGTMSIAQRLINKNPHISMILTDNYSIYCPLRAGFKHKITIPQFINLDGCGLITFQKITDIQTSGFKWNLGKKQLHDTIEWGKFLSTSNQITGKQITIESSKQQGIINFVANFKQF